MDRREIVRTAWRVLEPQVAEQGYELVEVEYTGPSGRPTLRLFLDQPAGGITLDDCAAMSHVLSPVLDAADFIDGNYILEVSSPGVDRPLRKPADFERFVGEEVRLTTHAPTRGRKKFTGVVKGLRDGMISLECDGAEYEIHLENLKKANLNR